jgi:hypothetical protein
MVTCTLVADMKSVAFQILVLKYQDTGTRICIVCGTLMSNHVFMMADFALNTSRVRSCSYSTPANRPSSVVAPSIPRKYSLHVARRQYYGNAQKNANTAWACATLGHPSPPLFREISEWLGIAFQSYSRTLLVLFGRSRRLGITPPKRHATQAPCQIMNDGSAGSFQYLEVADSPHEFLLPCPDAVGLRLVGSKFFCLAVADKLTANSLRS